MLRELSERYARRAREFSEAVAGLGRYPQIGPEFLRLIREIMRRQRLCNKAADELDQYVQRATTNLDLAQVVRGRSQARSFPMTLSGRRSGKRALRIELLRERYGAGRSDRFGC